MKVTLWLTPVKVYLNAIPVRGRFRQLVISNAISTAIIDYQVQSNVVTVAFVAMKIDNWDYI